MQDPMFSPLLLEAALVLLGAALGGLLLTPFMRIMRSFVSALEVPDWGEQRMCFPPWLTFTLHLNLVLPALAMFVWVQPPAPRLPLHAPPPACYEIALSAWASRRVLSSSAAESAAHAVSLPLVLCVYFL